MMELIGGPVFFQIRRHFYPNAKPFENKFEAFKGILERIVLFSGLVGDYQQILTLFGALKLANRLDAEDKTDKGRNYFLIGNLVSVLLVFAALALHAWLLPLDLTWFIVP